MRWVRVVTLAAFLAAAVLVAVTAVPVGRWITAEFQRRAGQPDPVPATPEETRAILAAVFAEMTFAGAPPPPGHGTTAPPAPRILVADASICFTEHTVADCDTTSAEYLLTPALDAFAPRKLREELIIANRTPRPLDLSGMSGVDVARASEIRRMFATRGWDAFHERYPGSPGFVRTSQPVLSRDRRMALIVVAHHCGGLCGTGTLVLLARSGDGWRVLRQEGTWVS
jgi:hypothetical protein